MHFWSNSERSQLTANMLIRAELSFQLRGMKFTNQFCVNHPLSLFNFLMSSSAVNWSITSSIPLEIPFNWCCGFHGVFFKTLFPITPSVTIACYVLPETWPLQLQYLLEILNCIGLSPVLFHRTLLVMTII